MKKVLIFSGTTEGRILSEYLEKKGINTVICVASEYGQQVMNKSSCVEIHKGRMTPAEMEEMMRMEDFSVCVDATHPFAVKVSENIREATEKVGLKYIRLQRNTMDEDINFDNLFWFDSGEQCAEALKKTEGNILLTTGSKELSIYCRDESLRKRIFARVLPGIESLSICYEQGLEGRQIIAMQGPFVEEMNVATLKQYEIKYMVTKETGKTGGFAAKVRAAEKAGVVLYVIGNPEKKGQGYSFEQVVREIENE